MYHPQYNITYPLGAFIQDYADPTKLFNNDLNVNNLTKITKDDLLIELIRIEIWMEQNKLINRMIDNQVINHLKEIDESTQKYDFYISEQTIGSIYKVCNISFHSIVNYNVSPNNLQYIAYEKKIKWSVVPIFGHIEPFVQTRKAPTVNTHSIDDCLKGCQKQQPIRMNDRRIELNHTNHRSRIIKNRKYNRNEQNTDLISTDYIEQCIWIREMDGILRFGSEITGKVRISELFGMLYFISIVSIPDLKKTSVTLHRINSSK